MMDIAEQEEIFNNWITHHKSLLFKVVRAYGDLPEDQDDLFQEICIQVWRSIPKFKHESKVSTWLYKVALNTAMKWLKVETKKKYKEYEISESPVLLVNQKMDQDPRVNWIYEQITLLSESDRSIALMLLDGFSYKEMGDVTGLTISNVGVKINRIKKYLIEKSEHYNHEI
jgi:RNA polymerase sigma-70 factor (ECF subfamily)